MLTIAVGVWFCYSQFRVWTFFRAGNFDFSGAQITPEIVNRCPGYIQNQASRVLHIQYVDGMTGGQLTITFELPASRLQAFLDASPFKNAARDSVPAAGAIPKQNQYNGTGVSVGRTHYIIRFDRTSSDAYTVFFQETS